MYTFGFRREDPTFHYVAQIGLIFQLFYVEILTF